jgi:hypothetical protein
MLPAPPKSSKTRAIILLILRDSEHLKVRPDDGFAEQADVKSGRPVLSGYNSPSQGSNPPAPARQSGNWRLYSQKWEKCPPMAAFSKLEPRLWTPNLCNYRAKSAIVSGGYLKYSHFWETATGAGFDRHCVAEVAVQLAKFSAFAAGKLGTRARAG